MLAFFEQTLFAFASLFFVVDPFGVIPTYLGLAESYSPRRRVQTIRTACLTATSALILFAITGSFILRLFGVTMPAFRVAGGIILLLLAIEMTRAQRSTQEGDPELREGAEKNDIAITPLAIPMLAGPAALTAVAMQMHGAANMLDRLRVLLSILLVGLASYGSLRLAERLFYILGETGIRVASRIMGLLIAAMAVQIMMDGLAEWPVFRR